MRILAFADLHLSKRAYLMLKKKSKKSDLILCAGDISIFSNALHFILKKLDQFKKPILMIHGNHESERNLKKECRNFKNIFFIHKKIYKTDNVVIMGFGGGGFSQVDSQLSDFSGYAMKRINKLRIRNKNIKVILLTHAPPYNTKLDRIGKEYYGNKTITKLIKNVNPDYAISGHFHENFSKTDMIGKTSLLNPGPAGRIIKL